jgi:integrase/recombinase XerD
MMTPMEPALSFVPASRPGGENDSALVELWLGAKVSPHTRRAYRAEITRLCVALPKPLVRITLADLQAYAESRSQASLKPASQNRALTAIKSLLSFGHETGYLPFNVGAVVKLRLDADRLNQRILEESEVSRLIDRTPPGRDQVLLRLLYTSGIRVSELAQLKWCDLQPRAEGGQITVFGKRGKTRAILLKPRTWAQLIALRGSVDDAAAPVFRSRKGGHLDVSQIRRIVYAAAARAGLPQKVSPHWLRHAHATHALDRSAPIHLVQATLGHASVSTTGRYLHARPTDSSSLYLPD